MFSARSRFSRCRLTMAFSKVFNIEPWNVRRVMPKLNDIKVVLAPKKVDICGIQNSKTDSVEENENSSPNRKFLDRKRIKQLGMEFLVNKPLKVTSSNPVNERIATLTVNKKINSKLNQRPLSAFFVAMVHFNEWKNNEYISVEADVFPNFSLFSNFRYYSCI